MNKTTPCGLSDIYFFVDSVYNVSKSIIYDIALHQSSLDLIGVTESLPCLHEMSNFLKH